jgi:Tfp pilus assembly protein PilV
MNDLLSSSLVSRKNGFSLIEVVLAVGVVSFSLLAIFGILSVSLKSSSEKNYQHEVIGITRSLNDFLRSTNTNYGAGFSTVSNWISSGTDPGIYCFASSNGAFTYGVGQAASEPLSNRSGRLFRMVLTLSTNASGVSSIADVATNAMIPLQVRIYVVPDAVVSVTNLQPAYTYDTAVFR